MTIIELNENQKHMLFNMLEKNFESHQNWLKHYLREDEIRYKRVQSLENVRDLMSQLKGTL